MRLRLFALSGSGRSGRLSERYCSRLHNEKRQERCEVEKKRQIFPAWWCGVEKKGGASAGGGIKRAEVCRSRRRVQTVCAHEPPQSG